MNGKKGTQADNGNESNPQADGVSEVNDCMEENVFRFYCVYHQKNCEELLPEAEFAYNSFVSYILGLSSTELDLGLIPRFPLDLTSGSMVPVQSLNGFC